MKISQWQKVGVVGCIAAGSLVAAQPALADSHRPFSASSAFGLIAETHDGATQLFSQSFVAGDPQTPLGSPWAGNGTTTEYNALGYSSTDGYAYAIANSWSGGNRNLLQIGSDGSVVDLGAVDGLAGGFINNGAIVDGRHLLVIDQGGRTLYSIDVQTRKATTRALSEAWRAADFTPSKDPNVVWGVYGDIIQRLNLTTGKVDTFANTLSDTSTGGSIFTYPNGDLGFVTGGGRIIRFRVDDPDAAAPAFTHVSNTQGAGSSTADGTSVGGYQATPPTGHQPFDPNANLGLWSPSNPGSTPTQLYSVDLTKPNTPSAPLGAPWAGNGRVNTYNALSYNTQDGYAYAITGNFGTRDNHLIQIGSDGTVTEIGKLTSDNGNPGAFLHVGTIVDGKLLATEPGLGLLLSIDLKTARYTQTTLSGATWRAADFTSNDGRYLWGAIDNTFQRIDLSTGTVREFANTVVPTSATYGSGGILNAPGGDFVLSGNGGDGSVYRFHVANPGSDSPTFSLVAKGTGPASGDNDGTSTVDAG